MLVKIANLRRLAGYPDVQRVTTFNAAENDHMLAINVALGFRPAGWDGEWQRSVAPEAPEAADSSGVAQAQRRAGLPVKCAGVGRRRKVPGAGHGMRTQTGIC